VVYRGLRLGVLHQLHPGRSRSLVRYHDCLHGNFSSVICLFAVYVPAIKARSTSNAGGLASSLKRRGNSAFRLVSSLAELLGAGTGLTKAPTIPNGIAPCISEAAAFAGHFSCRSAGRSFPIAGMYSFHSAGEYGCFGPPASSSHPAAERIRPVK